MSHRFAAALAAALISAGPASAQTQAPQPQAAAKPVHPGEEEGLGLNAPEVPQILKDARFNPYLLPQPLDCPSLAKQLADLTAVLGPDLDEPQAKKNTDPDVMAGVRAVLPYGGVVRFFTRAGHGEHAMVNAALAGWERRGFLKGLARSQGCPGFAALQPVSAPASP
jgi:hypothetical protein